MNNKIRIWKYRLVELSLIIFLINSCKKTDQAPNTVTDIDGNVYKTVIIDTQIWMAENLKTTKFNDGSKISYITDSYYGVPGYCWYNDSSNYKASYGALYNYYTVNTGKICPAGWHVPTDTEWSTLLKYLGGEGVAGGKLKETGLTHWLSPNTGATNESGFTALPGGFLFFDGTFKYICYCGVWWSSTEYDSEDALIRFINYNDSSVAGNSNNKRYGFSVRCLWGS